MSVKGKVKRINRELENLNREIAELKKKNNILEIKKDKDKILLENIVKFAITNHVGGLRAGMAIDWDGIDKMKDLKLDIETSAYEHSYIFRVNYY